MEIISAYQYACTIIVIYLGFLNLVETQEQEQFIVNATWQCSIPRNKSLKSKTPELSTHQSENKSWI